MLCLLQQITPRLRPMQRQPVSVCVCVPSFTPLDAIGSVSCPALLPLHMGGA